jgi:folate-dependent phosphoribosylglycinamide formyltransferase PurN
MSPHDTPPAAPPAHARLRVVVLTCAAHGLEMADTLAAVSGIDVLAVIHAPLRRGPWRKRLRRAWRNRGLLGLLQIAAGRLRGALMRVSRRTLLPPASPGHRVPVRYVHDFHDAEALEFLRSLAPDVAVVDGTYILQPSVFDLPRLGSLNLHCGRVPEFRGSPPVFWELFRGVREVGVTIHRVSAQLDEGPILAERSFPLEPAPAGDPVRHADHVWRTVLRPAGLEMMADTVRRLCDGSLRPRPQPPSDHPPNRTPALAEVRELRRRVRQRRREAGPSSADSG